MIRLYSGRETLLSLDWQTLVRSCVPWERRCRTQVFRDCYFEGRRITCSLRADGGSSYQGFTARVLDRRLKRSSKPDRDGTVIRDCKVRAEVASGDDPGSTPRGGGRTSRALESKAIRVDRRENEGPTGSGVGREIDLISPVTCE